MVKVVLNDIVNSIGGLKDLLDKDVNPNIAYKLSLIAQKVDIHLNAYNTAKNYIDR